MVILPGGFSGGDEPDGSGKFIASFLRDAGIKDSIHELLNKRDGLMLGICNGFQALIKLGLVPYGEIRDEMTGDDPTLTFNLIGRHQSRYATTRVASVKSPWLSSCNVGDLHSIAFSHGEGRFVAPQNVIDEPDQERSGSVPVHRSATASRPWTSRGTRTARCARSRVSPLRTAVSSARWVIPSVTARLSARISTAKSISRCSQTA